MSTVSRRRRAAVGKRIGASTLLVALGACAHRPPKIDGVRGDPPSQSTLWPVPAAVRTPAPPAAPPVAPAATAALARDSAAAGSVRQLSLDDVVDLALRNNPATRESWETARAAASTYGVARGALFPTLTASTSFARTQGSTISANGQTNTGTIQTTNGSTITRTQLAPSVQLSYLLFDLGGRSGNIEAAKQRAIAANLSHNATVVNTVLETEARLFSYLAAHALRDAQVETVNEAQADLAAATERQRVGVATVQEVLQTRTELSQARFQLATLEGDLLGARGNLAQAIGLPANARFEIPDVQASDSVADVSANVDSLINHAIAERPELAELRAQAAALAAQIRVARAAALPSVSLTASSAYIGILQSSNGNTNGQRNFSVGLGLSIPLFGYGFQYAIAAARENYEAGRARVAATEQQITVQVFTSYYVLRAATERVRSSSDLLASAEQSATVALARYREGVGTIVDVLLTRSSLATARAEAIQARWEWRTALAQLAHDAGALDLRGHPNLPLTVADTAGPHR